MSDEPSGTRSIDFDGPLSLRATLGGGTLGSPGDGRQHAMRSARTPEGPATVRIEVWDQRIEATAWGPGSTWMLDRVPDLVGLDDDPTTFVAQHEIIERLARRFPGLRIGRTGVIWETLAHTILGQKVTTTEAERGWRGLVRTYGEPAPGPTDRWLGPPPEALAALAYHDFHPHGIERKRATILIEAARRAKRLEEAAAMNVDDAYRRLMAVRGIGIWTASLVLGEAIGDPNAIAIGDYHIPNTVTWALAGEPRGNDERMIELLEPYDGHRARVVRLLHLGGIGAPKYGPRTRPRDIRRH